MKTNVSTGWHSTKSHIGCLSFFVCPQPWGIYMRVYETTLHVEDQCKGVADTDTRGVWPSVKCLTNRDETVLVWCCNLQSALECFHSMEVIDFHDLITAAVAQWCRAGRLVIRRSLVQIPAPGWAELHVEVSLSKILNKLLLMCGWHLCHQ